MKKIISGLLALALCLPVVGQAVSAASLQAIAADKETVTVDGLTYELKSSGYAKLIGIADTSVTSITIPVEVNGYEVDDIIEPGQNLFSKCKNLEEINTENTEQKGNHSIDGVLFYNNFLVAYPRARKDAAYTIPEGTISVKNYAFSGADYLKSLTLADSLSDVGSYAFQNDAVLEEIVGAIPFRYEVCFINCPSLKAAEIAEPGASNSTKMMGVNIIDCPALETLTIPESWNLYDIGFNNCGIKTLTLDKETTNIFITCCDDLESIYITRSDNATPDNDRLEVYNCPNLKYIYADYDGKIMVKDCPQLNCIGLGNYEQISINNCPELTALKCYNYVRIEELFGVDKLTVYGSVYTSTGILEKWRVPYAPMETNPGDANDDGAFNLMDAVILQKYLLNAGRVTYWKNCDFNGDGKVNVIDLVLMKRALLYGE